MKDASTSSAIHVVAYLRVSTEAQVEGYGLDAQESSVRDYCEKNAYKLAQVFREEGVSGKNELDNRLALLDLNDYADKHDIRTIVIPELSRLARDLMIQESIIRDWDKRGWHVESVKEPDLAGSDPTRIFIRQVLGAVNQYDRSMIIARMRSGRMSKSRSGQHSTGATPLGYVTYEEDGKRQRRISEPAAEIVKTIYGLRHDGLSLQAIASRLNDLAITPPKAAQWGKTTIAAILRNRKYSGIVEFREDGEVLSSVRNEALRIV